MSHAIASLADYQDWRKTLKQRVQSVTTVNNSCASVSSVPGHPQHYLVSSPLTKYHGVMTSNKSYSESRTRAACKVRRKRDLLRVKCGNHDYCITGEIDRQALRQFQSSHRLPAKPFKLAPNVFESYFSRKVFQAGEKA